MLVLVLQKSSGITLGQIFFRKVNVSITLKFRFAGNKQILTIDGSIHICNMIFQKKSSLIISQESLLEAPTAINSDKFGTLSGTIGFFKIM